MADNNQLTLKLNPTEIMELGEKSKKIIFKPEFEEELAKLLKFQELINDTVAMVQHEIQKTGDMLMPNFTGITGTKIKGTNRAYGALYKIVDKNIVDPSFIKEFTSVRTNAEAKTIEEYLATMGELPAGIEENARVKSFKVELIKEKVPAIK